MKKTSSRPGRYKHQLVSEDFFSEWAPSFSAFFRELQEQRQKKIISDSEMVTLGVISMLAARMPQAFEKNGQKVLWREPSASWKICQLIEQFQKYNLPTSAFEKFKDSLNENVFQWIQTIRFRGIPEAGRQGLLNWIQGHYPLILCLYIPTPDEVFQWQKKGQRCVSFFLSPEDLCTTKNHRDTLSFIIHDLIHADEFYRDPARKKQQIGFYGWIERLEEVAWVQKMKQNNVEFVEKWDYLRSDMNSYCGHLLKTVHSVLEQTRNAELKQKYAQTPEVINKSNEFNFFWQDLIAQTGLNSEELAVFSRLHTPDWQAESDFFRIEQTFENFAQH